MREKQLSLAVHLHLYYLDMWPEIKGYLANIGDYPYDLFVTLVAENPQLEEEIKAFKPDAKIWIVENRGYDIGPFIDFLHHIDLDKYKYVIKLHTKRDLKQKVQNIGNSYGCSGGMWREWLLFFLQKDNLRKCISALDKDEKLGACCYYKCIHPIKDFLGTGPDVRKKYKDYMFGLPSFYFIAGTMFIMRAALLSDIQKMDIHSELFDEPDENHTVQFAHLIERTLGEVVYFHHCYIRDVFTPFASLRRAFFLSLQYLKRFLFQKKITHNGKMIIKILKIPFLQFDIKDNGRTYVYFLGIRLFNKRKPLKSIWYFCPSFLQTLIAKYSSKPKCVVYTCISGEYDDLIKQTYINHNFDYVCFTDNQKLLKRKKVGFWQIRPLVFTQSDQTRNARWHKTHPHVLFPEYDLSIWIDSNIDVLSRKMFDLAETGKDLLVPYHYERDCIYDECKAVIDNKKDSLENVTRILNILTENHMPTHYGLNETGILIRHHNVPLIKEMMDEWWSFIEKYTKRDQLSFSYVLWKNGIRIPDISFENARFDCKNYWFDKHISERKDI